ncbi:hypothetical protein IQ07DRAFT_597239 [Pyrenochaeta sp. DS3sAY3a]|nr:hypothetical protein IQ07DRAFT_597239 [Pyrenochaeta sp. DS3sAY3a]
MGTNAPIPGLCVTPSSRNDDSFSGGGGLELSSATLTGRNLMVTSFDFTLLGLGSQESARLAGMVVTRTSFGIGAEPMCTCAPGLWITPDHGRQVDRSSGDSGDPSRNWGAGMLIAAIIATGITKQVETSRRFPGRGWSSLLWHEANGFGMFGAQAQRDSSSAGLGGGMFRGALDGACVAASRGRAENWLRDRLWAQDGHVRRPVEEGYAGCTTAVCRLSAQMTKDQFELGGAVYSDHGRRSSQEKWDGRRVFYLARARRLLRRLPRTRTSRRRLLLPVCRRGRRQGSHPIPPRAHTPQAGPACLVDGRACPARDNQTASALPF